METTTLQSAEIFPKRNSSHWGESHNWDWHGFKCHWRVLGEDNQRILLFLHGFGASSSHWRNNAAYFAKAGFKVYAVDLIGFGKSEQPGSNKLRQLNNLLWSEQVSDFLKEIAGANRFNKAILIGNSLGGLVALTTAVFKPELIEALVTAPLPDPALMKTIKISSPKILKNLKNTCIRIFFNLLPLELLITLFTRTKLIKTALQSAYYKSIKSDKELYKIVLNPAIRPSAARALRSMCIGMSTRPPFITAPVLLNELSKSSNCPPMLMIWGKQDQLVPLVIGERILQKHPWINFKTIINSGHCVHDECSEEFNNFVLRWLELNLGEDRRKA